MFDHQPSLEALPQVLDDALADHPFGPVAVRRIAWDPAGNSWVPIPRSRTGAAGQSDNWAWARRMLIDYEVTSGKSAGRSQASVWVPVACNDDAVATEPSQILVGRHTGIWWTGPRIPMLVAAYKPGLHLAARPGTLHSLADELAKSDGEPSSLVRLTAVLVPDLGRRATLTVRIGSGPPGDPIPVDASLFRKNSWATDETVNQVKGLLADSGGHFYWHAKRKKTEKRLWLPEIDLQKPPVWAELPTSPDAMSLLPLGGVLATVLYRSIRRELTKGPRAPQIVSQRLTQAVSRLVLGRSGMGMITVPAEQTNILATAEQGRTVTFKTALGLGAGDIRGLLDLRDLDPGWRDTLCPLQTRESTDIGLFRHLSLAHTPVPDGEDSDRAQWGDLSLSAALIPFVNHDEPARALLASKTIKQALPLTAPEPPLVRTGVEASMAEALGVSRSPARGRIERVLVDRVEIATRRRGARALLTVPYGQPEPNPTTADGWWMVLVEKGQEVSAGELLAFAPGVVPDSPAITSSPVGGGSEGSESPPIMALGVNAFVALMPWQGLNFEDGIVVSRSFAERMSSWHALVFEEPLAASDRLYDVGAENGDEVAAGQSVATIVSGDAVLRDVRAPEDGIFLSAAPSGERNVLQFQMRCQRALEIGDKLTNRHQGKGVVTAIIPDEAMPRTSGGRIVDVIMNPLGITRRLNVGQLWEMHVGLLAEHAGLDQVTVGRSMADVTGLRAAVGAEPSAPGAADERTWLREALAEAEVPGGRMALTLADGTEVGPAEGVVVGPQYILKLNHLAADKLGVRGEGSRSPVTLQPTQRRAWRQGTKSSGAQRLGEMELWALLAAGADAVVADALRVRGVTRDTVLAAKAPRPTLHAIAAHLAAAGIRLVADLDDGSSTTDLIRVDLTTISRFRLEALGADERLGPLPTWDWEGAIAEGNRRFRAGRGNLLHDPELHGLTDLERQTLATEITLPGRIVSCEWEEIADTRADQCEVFVLEQDAPTAPLPPRRENPKEGSGRRNDEPKIAVAGNGLRYHGGRWHNIGSVREVPAEGVEPVQLIHPWLRTPMRRIPILPPAYRLPGQVERLDTLYTRLAAQVEAYPKSGQNRSTVKQRMQQTIDEIWGAIDPKQPPAPGSLAARLGGKTGLLRRWGLGQTAENSGRAVIVADPERDPQTVGLPRQMYERIVASNPDDEFADVVLLNRQPSLRPYTIMALRARPIDSAAIAIHPLLLGALAGDFDGDTVAIHGPRDRDARRQAWELLRPAVNQRTAGDGSLLASLGLDITLGLALEGRIGPGGVNELAETAVAEREDPDDQLEALAGLAHQGWSAASAWSIGAVDLDQPGSPSAASLVLAKRVGVAGKEQALRQLLEARGLVPGNNPLIPVREIPGNFLAGLSDANYFDSVNGSLRGLADKKLLTPQAGALTKSLSEIGYEVVVAKVDCGAGTHSPITCADPTRMCQACVGSDPATGRPFPIGTRIGLLAASLIGERSTQLSMKAFQGGSAGTAVEGDVTDLRGLFGHGRDSVTGSLRTALTEAVPNTDSPSAEVALRATDPLLERFNQIVKGKVDALYAAVILRQLWEAVVDPTRANGRGTLAQRAETRGKDALGLASNRGAMGRWVRDQVGAEPEPVADSLRTKVLVGGVA